MTSLLHGTLAGHARHRPEDLAVVFGDRRLNYRQLHDRVQALAGGLTASGVGVGDRCGLVMRNCPEFVEAAFAISAAGAVFSAVNALLVPDQLVQLVDRLDPAVLIVDGKARADLGQRAEPAPAGIGLVLCSESAGEAMTLDSLAQRGGGELPTVRGDMVLRISYTSGTTGSPKEVVVTHSQHTALFVQYLREFALNERDRLLVASPLFFQGGLTFATLPLFVGATLYLEPDFNARRALDLIRRERVTAAFLVPTMLFKLMEALEEEDGRDLSSLRLIVTGGAPRSEGLRQRMARLFPQALIFESYGSTESGLVTSLRPEDQRDHLQTVGRPALGVEIEIRDDDGLPVEPMSEGQICVRSPSVASGYFGSARTTQAFTDGWCPTGDIGLLDPDGFLHLRGRQSDLIISGGINILPNGIEEALGSHPRVRATAVVGVPDELWGERVVAVIVADEHPGLEDELIEWCRRRLPQYMLPKAIKVVDDLPLNASGKVHKEALRDAFHR